MLSAGTTVLPAVWIHPVASNYAPCIAVWWTGLPGSLAARERYGEELSIIQCVSLLTSSLLLYENCGPKKAQLP